MTPYTLIRMLALLLLSMSTIAEPVGVLGGLRGSLLVDRNGAEIQISGGSMIQVGDHFRADEGQLFQLILRDETTLTFGGGADVTLDVFEFDELTGEGELQITQFSGLMKFATGRIANGHVGVFRIRQPQLEIAVLGTMGVVGVLSQEQTSHYFPQVDLPNATGPVSYAALMGPGQRAASITKSGAFQVTANGQVENITRPGGSVLANENSGPVTFIAPPLAMDKTMIAQKDDDDESETATNARSTHSMNSSLSSDLANSMPLPEMLTATPSDNDLNSESSSILRDVRSFIDRQSLFEALGELEQNLISPTAVSPNVAAPDANSSDSRYELEPLTPLAPLDPIGELAPLPPLEPLLPIDELEPITPIDELAPLEPIDELGPLDPIGMMCPGDPACP